MKALRSPDGPSCKLIRSLADSRLGRNSKTERNSYTKASFVVKWAGGPLVLRQTATCPECQSSPGFALSFVWRRLSKTELSKRNLRNNNAKSHWYVSGCRPGRSSHVRRAQMESYWKYDPDTCGRRRMTRAICKQDEYFQKHQTTQKLSDFKEKGK